jgi:hypothetical protein
MIVITSYCTQAYARKMVTDPVAEMEITLYYIRIII